MSLRLYKTEKVCGEIAVSRLFNRTDADNNSLSAFPLRIIWRDSQCQNPKCSRFLISVPKRRFRHAVDRVKLRRRIREAYRLNRHLLPQGKFVDILFIYLPGIIMPYSQIERGMVRALSKLQSHGTV